MDVVHDYVNTQIELSLLGNILNDVGLPYDNVFRAFAIFWVLLALGGVVLYFLTAGISYYVIFILFPDKLLEKDEREKHQEIAKEIKTSLEGIQTVTTLTTVMYMLHWYGYGKIYTDFNDYGAIYLIGSIVAFLMFTDCLIFWIHYALHWKPLYQRFHSTHHKFKYPTPFAAIAFDPFDGFAQSFPYHLFTFVFPFWNWAYLCMFVFVQVWTISIHDRVSFASLDGIINGSAHHRAHHFFHRYNYGQYTTIWDRLMKTHRVWNGGKITPATTGFDAKKDTL